MNAKKDGPLWYRNRRKWYGIMLTTHKPQVLDDEQKAFFKAELLEWEKDTGVPLDMTPGAVKGFVEFVYEYYNLRGMGIKLYAPSGMFIA